MLAPWFMRHQAGLDRPGAGKVGRRDFALSTVVVVGAQWGDEGKGKITDFLAEQADVVARYQGGNNAGHTILIQGKSIS